MQPNPEHLPKQAAKGDSALATSLSEHLSNHAYNPAQLGAALIQIARVGYLSSATILLDNGADANCPNLFTSDATLCVASAAGHDDMVRLLIQNGANVNPKKFTSTIEESAANKVPPALQNIIENFIDPQDRINHLHLRVTNNNPLELAAENDCLSTG